MHSEKNHIVPIRPIMEAGALPKRPDYEAAARDELNARPETDRRYHSVLVGDLIIYVQFAREEAARTGQPFDACLADILVEELGG